LTHQLQKPFANDFFTQKVGQSVNDLFDRTDSPENGRPLQHEGLELSAHLLEYFVDMDSVWQSR
jgi:hypothetical protein